MMKTMSSKMSKKWPRGWCGRVAGVAAWMVTTNLARGALACPKKSGVDGGVPRVPVVFIITR
jgi:hypothetical protein